MNNGVLTNLKGYEVIERIGAGGFGAVYRAKQTTINREVAIKVILPGRSNQPAFIRRFETEAHLIARLEHPHITPLVDYWRDPEGAYLVMRYLRGGSLRQALAKGPYELDTITTLLDQIASALEFAHRQQVIHRDIKPDNILLDEDGNAYLTDFGIAKDLTLQDAQTNPNAITGSVDYISPEQIRNEAVTARTDIYSLGVMLFEMIMGTHPFENVSPFERLYQHISAPLPKINNLPEALSDALNAIIQKATAKDPAQRYPDVMTLAIAFKDVIRHDDSTTQDLLTIQKLTLREHEILQLIADGLTNRQIAEQLFITIGTTKWHVNQLYKKLGVRSRVQAIIRAREMALIITDSDDEIVIGSEQSATISISLPEPENPYKGLHSFQTADARDFFGRDELVQKLIARMNDSQSRYCRFLAIVGPSGSGKSSLVKAGIIPALWQGGLRGSEKWFVVDMMPGNDPLGELETALTRVAANQAGNLRDYLTRDERGLVRAAALILPHDDTELVVLIDQFEEIFTLVDDEKHRQHFLDLLHTAIADNRSRVRVIVTLRADYYDKPLHYPKFGELLRVQMETVLPLSAKGLERAISAPAERVGVTFEPGLVAEIVSEMTYQAGALPLLQYAMTELFEQREGRVLTRAAYQAIGGAVGALANRADEIFLSFNEEAQGLTRQLFLRLVTLGEGAEDTRRRVKLQEIMSLTDNTDMMEELIDAFASHRLLALDRDEATRSPTLEVAHEAILREWERLRYWLNESRDDIRQERLIALAASAWDNAGREASFLLRGSRLEQSITWRESTQLTLTPLETNFIDNSIRQREQEQLIEAQRQVREAAQERRSQFLLRGLIVLFAIASTVGITLTILAIQARNDAELAALESRSIAVAINAEKVFDTGNRTLGLSLAYEAANILDSPPPEVHRILVELAYAPGLYRTIQSASPIKAIAVNPISQTVAISNALTDSEQADGNIYLWDTALNSVIQTFIGHTDVVTALTFSTNGQYLVSGSANGEIIIWNVSTGMEIQRLSGHDEQIWSVYYSPDNQSLVSASADNTIRIWNVETGKLTHELVSHTDEVLSAKFTLNNNQIVSSSYDDTLRLWDISTGESVIINEGYDDPDTTNYNLNLSFEFEFTPDGQYGLFGSRNGQVYVTNLSTLETETHLGIQTDSTLNSVDISPDGEWLIAGGDTAVISVWDISTGEERFRFSDHIYPINKVRFIEDGHRAITTAIDGTIHIYDLVAANTLRQFTAEGTESFWGLAISPDGRILAAGEGATDHDFVASEDVEYQIILWDTVTGEEIRRLDSHPLSIWDIDISSDNRHLVASSRDGLVGVLEPRVRVWDMWTGDLVREFAPGAFWYTGVQFSPDGRTLMLTGDTAIHLLDFQSGQLIRRLIGHSEIVGFPNFSADGRSIVSGSWDSSIILWDVESGQQLTRFEQTGVTSANFLPDGRSIMSTSWGGGKALIWDIESGKIVREYDATSNTLSVGVSPDGRFAAFLGQENSIVVINLQNGSEIARYVGHTSNPRWIEFHPDGQRFYSSSWDGTVREWLLPADDTSELVEWVDTNRVVRQLTSDEQMRYGLLDRPETQRTDFSAPENPTPTIQSTITPFISPIVSTNAILGENHGYVAEGEWERWRYQGQAGETVFIRVETEELPQDQGENFNTFYPQYSLYNPEGLMLYTNNFVYRGEIWQPYIESYQLPADGPYYIEVMGTAYLTSGYYTLIIESDRDQ